MAHRTSREIEMGKNIQSTRRLLWERPRPELRNEPPLDSLDPQSPNPFMASPSPDPIQRLAIKGFRDWGSRLSSGGSFRSPGWGRSRSSLEIDWIFFCHFNFPESSVPCLNYPLYWWKNNFVKSYCPRASRNHPHENPMKSMDYLKLYIYSIKENQC